MQLWSTLRRGSTLITCFSVWSSTPHGSDSRIWLRPHRQFFPRPYSKRPLSRTGWSNGSGRWTSASLQRRAPKLPWPLGGLQTSGRLSSEQANWAPSPANPLAKDAEPQPPLPSTPRLNAARDSARPETNPRWGLLTEPATSSPPRKTTPSPSPRYAEPLQLPGSGSAQDTVKRLFNRSGLVCARSPPAAHRPWGRGAVWARAAARCPLPLRALSAEHVGGRFYRPN